MHDTSHEVLVAFSDTENYPFFREVVVRFGLTSIFSANSAETQVLLARRPICLAFCEERLPQGGYREVLGQVVRSSVRIPVIVVSRTSNWNEYLKVLHDGAFDCLTCPLRLPQVEEVLKHGLREFYARNTLRPGVVA
ncbi:MAG: hypothetical protein HY012_07705 [Acidobacteria bacterium]|nr:hypothetical protein [Acidobacteriota bacterium]